MKLPTVHIIIIINIYNNQLYKINNDVYVYNNDYLISGDGNIVKLTDITSIFISSLYTLPDYLFFPNLSEMTLHNVDGKDITPFIIKHNFIKKMCLSRYNYHDEYYDVDYIKYLNLDDIEFVDVIPINIPKFIKNQKYIYINLNKQT